MSCRVLVVDDDRSTLKLVEYVLTEAGYEVDHAHDGAEGLAKVNTFLPHLIIADVVMPHLDGLEMCRRVREVPGYELVPFVFLSARTQIAAQIEGLETGADDYIPKPFGREEFVARVEAVLRRAQAYERAAQVDWLTSLGTRDLFEQRLREELYREMRYGAAAALALVAIDLGEIEIIRERHGSAGADRLIRAVGHFLRGHLRALDVPSRYSETGFVVLMPHTDRNHAEIAVERLRRELDRQEVRIDEASYPVRAGYGLAVVDPERTDDIRTMIQRAQQTMIAARRCEADEPVVWAEQAG